MLSAKFQKCERNIQELKTDISHDKKAMNNKKRTECKSIRRK